MFTMALVRTSSDSLKQIDYGMMFFIIWAASTAFISNAVFLASLCKTETSASTLIMCNILLALITTVSCSFKGNLNNYGFSQYGCVLTASGYNAAYTPNNGFVQFLVYFMPWFHSSQALLDVLSLVQYVGLHVGFSNSDFEGRSLFSGSSMFHSPWIGYSIGMLWANAVMYVVLAWFVGLYFSTDETEGRSLVSIFIPLWIRNYFKTDETEAIEYGDVRAGERLKSDQDKSVRAYKVSKTFKEVQALKEVSFSMEKGQVFVLLGHNGAG